MVIKKKAFTLIELIIAISILLILLLIAIASFNTYDRRNNLILTADAIKSFVLTASADAKSRSDDLTTNTIQGGSIELVLTVNNDGIQEIREYRLIDGQRLIDLTDPQKPEKIIRSLQISKSISVVTEPLTNEILLSISSPNAQFTPASQSITINIGTDSIKLVINGNKVDVTRNF